MGIADLVVLALVAAAMILVMSNTASLPLRLMIFMLVSPRRTGAANL